MNKVLKFPLNKIRRYNLFTTSGREHPRIALAKKIADQNRIVGQYYRERRPEKEVLEQLRILGNLLNIRKRKCK